MKMWWTFVLRLTQLKRVRMAGGVDFCDIDTLVHQG